MASIEVFPLNINGVQPPLNLLSNLLGGTGATSNFRYPLDLGANPNYGHAVTFTSLRRQYTGLKSALSDPFKAIAPQTALTGESNSQGTISLYMPDTLAVNYSHNYGEVSLTDALGPAAFLASAAADYRSSKKGGDNDTGNFWNPYGKALAAGAVGAVGKAAGVPELGSIAQNAIGNVTNPHLQMLYKGVGLREFQFEFIFTPSSAQEAQQVDNIIKMFTFWSSPAIVSGSGVSHHYLEPPYIFDIGFSFLGGSGLVGAVTNFFKNIETQILGQQLTGALAPSLGLSTPLRNAKIYTIYHPCVLKDISVDYAPNGWSSFNDGYPVQTRLNLQFKETDIVTKQDIMPGYTTAGPTTIQTTADSQPSAASFGPSAPLSNGVTIGQYEYTPGQ
jgi:Tail-tube assembly protein